MLRPRWRRFGIGHPPTGESGTTIMNKWILGAVLLAVAVFMYVSIIYKFGG